MKEILNETLIIGISVSQYLMPDKEEVSAVLSVLWSLSRVHPTVRKYLRTTILPPLTAKDIQVRYRDN